MAIVGIFIAVILFLSVLAVNHEKNKSKRIARQNEVSDKRKKDIAGLKKRNREFAERSAKTMRLREEAKFLEDEGNYDYAVMTYLKEIELSKEYKFGYSRFSRSIHRVIILYGKMNRYENLKHYLEKLLTEYPEGNVEDWQHRLEKVKTRLEKQNK